MRLSANTTVSSGRWKLIDVLTGGISFQLAGLTLSATQSNPNWEIYIDKDINTLAQPAQPSLAAATTGGFILRNTPVFVIITTVDANGTEGPPSDAYKTVTTGSSTDTNKVTVTISAVSGAASYNVYAGTVSGSEGFVGNTATTSFVITTLPTQVDLTNVGVAQTGSVPQLGAICPTTADFFIYGHKDGTEAINIARDYPVSYRVIVYVNFIATGQPSCSILLS